MLKRRKEEIFAALPHVTEIWVTDDGEFHLHPHNGGERVTNEPEIKIAAKIILKDSDKATENILNLNAK